MLESSIIFAFLASFLWGVLSIVLSPCHLSSIPLVIAFVSERDMKVSKAFIISLLFSFGIMLTIGIVGLITSLLGKMLGNIGIWGNIIVAVIFVVIGLYLLGVIKLNFLNNIISQPKFEKKSYITAFLLGLIFGLGLGPCTFAFMAPILGVVFKVSANNMFYAISLIAVYAIGHCLIIVLAGTFSKSLERYLKWNENSKAIDIIKKICGVLLILSAIYFVVSVLL
jgi:cytochrome c-type biogenesis protein